MSQIPERPRILLVEDEDPLRTALKRTLEKEGFEVVEATDGKAAQNLASFDTYCAVLTDIRMPASGISGIDLLRFIKSENAMPVILMTGFSELAETQEAFAAGADGFLAKPFKKGDLIQLLRKYLPETTVATSPNPVPSNGAPTPSPETNIATESAVDSFPLDDTQFCRVLIDDFVSGKEIAYNIFIRLKADRYVKIAHGGEDLSVERVRAYKDKGIRYLYLRQEDFLAYLRFSRVLTQAAKKSTALDRTRKLNLMRHANEVVLDHFHHRELSDDVLEDAKAVMEATIAVICELPNGADLLETLNQHSEHLYAHSLGVSFYSALLGQRMHWNSPQTLYTLSLAGLLHDIGKKELPKELLERPRGTLTLADLKLLESHVPRGTAILAQLRGISEEILVIVQQHHERAGGTGYPAKLLRTKIQPLAALIAVCDEFCKLVLSHPGQADRMGPVEAIERLFLLESATLDTTFLGQLAEMFGKDPVALRKSLGINVSLG